MATPPLFLHACKLHAAFLAASEPAIEADAQTFGVVEGAPIYVGHWSTEFSDRAKYPDLPGESTQQKAFAWLQEVDCIEVLRRGGRDYTGVMLIKEAPTEEDLDFLRADSRYQHSGRLGAVEVGQERLINRVKDLERAVENLQGQLDALVRDAELRLNQHHIRMAILEDKLL